MEDFEQRVKRFFNQFRSCLGIEPDLRASFVSKEQYPIYGDEELFSEIIESPRLPFDYSADLKQKMDPGWVPSDYERSLLIKKWKVDPKYKINTEIIKIKKAMVSDNLEVFEALLIIDEYELEYWGKKITDRNDILLFDEIIFDCINNWTKQRKADGKETVDFDALSYMFIDELHDKRKEFYNRLISSIKDEIIIEKKNFIIEEMGGTKFFVPLDNPPTDTNKDTPQAQDSEVKDSFNTADFVNNFDGKTWDAVHNHFDEKLRAKGFVSKEVLDKFIVEAFQYQNPPEEKNVCEKVSGYEADIVDAFFRYKEKYKVKGKKKEDYVKLLTDYFDPFEYQTIFNKFRKKDYPGHKT